MNFDEFCVTYNTDKSSKSHNFCEFYDKNLNLKNVKSLLEIGVKHGASLKSWAGYIPDAAIHGMDSSKKIAYQCRKENGEPKTECLGFPNIEIDYTDQNSKEQLKNSIGEKMFDLIIDDGGHKVDQQQNTLETYWNHINPGGAFIMEDLHTSYSKSHQADGYETTVDYLLKNQLHLNNFKEIRCNFDTQDLPESRNNHMTCIIYKKEVD